MAAARRFPVVLTVVAAAAFAILCGLGTWQYQRMEWKRDLLARIQTSQARPPVPLAEVLALAGGGEDVEFRRVSVACAANELPPSKVMLYGLRNGRPVWRPVAPCLIEAGAYGVIAVDRGVVAGETPRPPPMSLANPVRVTGVLRRPDRGPNPHKAGIVERAVTTYAYGDDIGYFDREGVMAVIAERTGRASPGYMLVAESETPAPPGVAPAPLPNTISNRHLEYVITWFGLAAALAAVYGAMLMRRLKS